MLYRGCNSFSLARVSLQIFFTILSSRFNINIERVVSIRATVSPEILLFARHTNHVDTCPRYFLQYYGSIERELMIFSPHACVQWFYYTRYNRINLAIVDQRFCKHRRIIYADGKGWIKEVGLKIMKIEDVKSKFYILHPVSPKRPWTRFNALKSFGNLLFAGGVWFTRSMIVGHVSSALRANNNRVLTGVHSFPATIIKISNVWKNFIL